MALITNAKGFTFAEIRNRVKAYIGNASPEFEEYIDQTMLMAQFAYCKSHDWSFLRKQGLSLSIVNGTNEYTLDDPDLTDGFTTYYMTASNVETIFSPAGSTILKRVDLNQIRRADPEEDDGSSTEFPTAWAPGSDENSILLWPANFQNDTLKIDGKISPKTTAVNINTDRPTVPYRYQEGLIDYIIAMVLDRENDDRAVTKKQEALLTIRQDIQDDMRNLGSIENPRIKHWREAQLDGTGSNLENLLFGLYFWQD